MGTTEIKYLTPLGTTDTSITWSNKGNSAIWPLQICMHSFALSQCKQSLNEHSIQSSTMQEILLYEGYNSYIFRKLLGRFVSYIYSILINITGICS